MKVFINRILLLLIIMFCGISFSVASEGIDMQDLVAERERVSERDKIFINVYFDVSSTLLWGRPSRELVGYTPFLFSPIRKEPRPGTLPEVAASDICEGSGYDKLASVEGADFRFTAEKYNSLIGKEIVRYNDGELQRIIVPENISELLGADVPSRASTRLSGLIDTSRGWDFIQETILLPSFTYIVCEKNL